MSDNNNNGFGCSPEDCASCGGGCDCSGGDCGSRMSEDHRTITLTLDDDTEVECNILTVYPVKDKEYIALLPIQPEEGAEPGEVYLYAFSVTSDGSPMLTNIVDDEEYAQAANAFNDILENARKVAEAGPEEAM